MNFKKKLQQISVINEPYTKWKWREQKVSYGKMYSDKTFFVIRRASCKIGLFSHVMTNAGWIDYAINNGYIPVVDMQNTANNYLENEKIGKDNAWEYYFQQPCGYTLKDIKNAKNVILSSGLIAEGFNYPDYRIASDEMRLLYWHMVFDKYIRPTQEILNELNELKRIYFANKRTLGILARGTDYVSSRPAGHPVQPSAEQIIEKAYRVMEEYSCAKIYLATEDAVIYRKFKTAFGEKLLSLETERYSASAGQNINDLIAEKQKSKVIKGKEYLLSIMLLANCNCLVAGNAGGTHGALLLNKGYDYKFIFELGTY